MTNDLLQVSCLAVMLKCGMFHCLMFSNKINLNFTSACERLRLMFTYNTKSQFILNTDMQKKQIHQIIGMASKKDSL